MNDPSVVTRLLASSDWNLEADESPMDCARVYLQDPSDFKDGLVLVDVEFTQFLVLLFIFLGSPFLWHRVSAVPQCGAT